MARPDITKLFTHHSWRLVDAQTKETMYFDQRVSTFDGQLGRLTWATPPKHDGSTGRVYVTIDGTGFQREFFPSVIGALWMNDETGF